MTDETLDAIAQALTSVPPRAVDPAVLADADPDVLAAALRRAVADLPASEQRARLAAAFSAMTPAGVDTAGSRTDALEAELLGAAPMPMRGDDRPKISAATAGLLALRPFTAVKAGALAGVAVLALLAGVLTGVATDDGTAEQLAVPGAAEDPIPLLRAAAFGNEPPTDEQVAAMFPPDPTAQTEAAEAAAADNPDVFEDAGIDPADAAYVPVPDVDPYVSGYVDGSGGDPGLPAQGDVAAEDGPAVADPHTAESPDTGGADGPDAGDESDEPGAGEPDTGDGTGSDGPASDGSGTGSGGTPDGDPPGLIDLCAGDTPVEGCEGVAGTVTLAVVEPFAFISDPTVHASFRSCVEDTDIDADEFIILVDANYFAEFTARFRIAGSGDAFTEVSGHTDDLWRESFNDSFRYTNICLVAQRPTLDATTLELEVSGVGEDDRGSAHFSGLVELPETEGARRRDGRPDVRVEALSASEFDVFVPIGEDEKAEVTVVTRGVDGSVNCDAPSIAEGEAVTAAVMPGGIVIHRDWRDQRFALTVEDPGAMAICVRWTDTFTPPNELERASILLDVPTVTTTSLLLSRYDQNPCLGGGCPSTPLAVWGTAELVGDSSCNGRLNQGSFVPAEPLELCTVSGLPQRIRLHTYAGFTRTDGGIRLDGVRETVAADFDPSCAEATCTTWYSVPVRAPGGLFEGNGGVVGRALFGIRIDGGTDGVAIGDEVPVKSDDAVIDGPRIDWSKVRASVDPADPARSVIVEWASDQPVSVTVSAEDANGADHSGCPVVENSSVAVATSGTIPLHGLCPGTRHYVSFELTAEDGRKTSYNTLRTPRVADVDWVQQSAPVTTDPLTVTYDYELTFTEYDQYTTRERPGLGVIPTTLDLDLPGHSVLDFRQYYFGEPYVGLDCAEVGHYDRSGSATGTVSGPTFGPVGGDIQFQTYRPGARGGFDTFSPGDRVCPSLYNQVNHTPTQAQRTCYVTIRNLVPERIRPTTMATSDELSYMLAGGEATFTARVDSRCGAPTLTTSFEAKLTVRIRPA